jgi:hypothetical protein
VDVIPPLSEWPEDLMVLLYERWAVRQFCGGQDEAKAKAAAIVEVWEGRDLTAWWLF